MDWDVADELRHRFSKNQLVQMYAQDPQLRTLVVDALYTAKGRDVEVIMRDAAFMNLRPGQTDENNHYFSLQYLARSCDQRALKELDRPENYKDSYPVSCMWWQTTLSTFGKCGYKPAIPLLARSLESACLNNTAAAERSLRKLMPKSECWKKAGLNGEFEAEDDCYMTEYRSSHKR